MKKMITIFAAALLLTGCAADSTAPADTQTTESQMEAAVVGMWLEQYTFPAGLTQLPLYFGNNSDEDYSISEEFSLTHTYSENGKSVTEELPYTDNGDSFTAIGIVIPAHGKTEFVADIAAHYGPLNDTRGHYTVTCNGFSADFFLSVHAEMPD